MSGPEGCQRRFIEETPNLGSENQAKEFPRTCAGRERKAGREGEREKKKAFHRVGVACARAQRHHMVCSGGMLRSAEEATGFRNTWSIRAQGRHY